MKDFIKYYVPCSEAQRTKIEVLRNEKRLKSYQGRNVLHSIGIDVRRFSALY